MGGNVGHSQVALGTELRFELVEEVQVDVHLLVGRAIKWTYRLRGSSAFRHGGIGEGDQRGVDVILIQLCAAGR